MERSEAAQLDANRPIEGTYVFDWRLSRKGYRLNKLAFSLSRAENRDAFKDNEEAYYVRFDLTEAEKELIRKRDFLGLVQAGTNIYMMLKLGAATGNGLYQMGAQQRGETYQQFLATRNNGSAT